MQVLKKLMGIVLGVVAIGLTACSGNMKGFKTESPVITHKVYFCGKKDRLDVVYFNDKSTNTQYAVINQMGEQIPMIEMVTASGIGFKAIHLDYSYQLHIKGSEATLFERDNKVVLDCKLDN